MKQKTLHVDFNDSTLGTIAREGEHNRTQLVFVLDEDLQACDFINIEFGIESSGEKLVLENLCPEEGDNTLKVSLTQDVTVSGVLTIQLVGYVIDSATAEPQIIAKSPVVSGAVTPSINGVKKIAQGVAGLLDRILAKVNDLAKKAHEHKNKNTLEGFICEALETGFETDASSTSLKWQGKVIDFQGFAAKIVDTEEKVVDGKKVFRVWLDWGTMPVVNAKEYFDIPIAGLKNTVAENSDGIKVNGYEMDLGIGSDNVKSLTSFPETAAEGDVVLLHRCNELGSDDSNSGVLLDIPAIVALGLPEGYEQRVWEITATDPKGGEGFSVTLEIKRIDDYILTGLFLATETIGGRWYWMNGEFTTDIAGASTDTVPVHVPLGKVADFTFTKTLFDIDYEETPDTDDTVIFRTLPLHYSLIGGEWQLAEIDDVADGAIISEVKELEKDGQKFLQLRLVDSRNKMLDDDIPKYINIPVAAINSVTDSSGGITLNGSELDLGIPDMETRIAALEDALTGATATADEILETIGGEE